MIVFSLPARRTGKSALEALTAPMTPWQYLTLRREAAGLTRRQLAWRVAETVTRKQFKQEEQRPIPSLDEAIALVDMLETPGARARYRETIELIGFYVPLDADVYHQLATEPPARHPTVCRGCGCSDGLTCAGDAGVCTWALPGVCTRCVERRVAQAGEA